MQKLDKRRVKPGSASDGHDDAEPLLAETRFVNAKAVTPTSKA